MTRFVLYWSVWVVLVMGLPLSLAVYPFNRRRAYRILDTGEELIHRFRINDSRPDRRWRAFMQGGSC